MSVARAPYGVIKHGQSNGGVGGAVMLWGGREIDIFIPQGGGGQGPKQAGYGLGSTPIGFSVKGRSRKHMRSPTYPSGSGT